MMVGVCLAFCIGLVLVAIEETLREKELKSKGLKLKRTIKD
jgi:hypothetical protein